MGMDRPGIEPSPSRMLSGCDTTTPTAPELSRPRVLKYLLRIAFSAEGPEGAASHKSFASRACAGSREEKERNQRSAPAAERKTRRTPLPTARTNQRSAPAAERKQKGRTSGP